MDEDRGGRLSLDEIRIRPMRDLIRARANGDRAGNLLEDRGRPRHHV
jgi:hypothetical protein